MHNFAYAFVRINIQHAFKYFNLGMLDSKWMLAYDSVLLANKADTDNTQLKDFGKNYNKIQVKLSKSINR